MEKTAIKNKDEIFGHFFHPDDMYANNIKHIVFNAMEEYASQFKQPSAWISVEDRLPDENGRYLVYSTFVANETWSFGIVSYTNEGGFFGKSMLFTSDITHWQPLPTPPNK